MTGPFDVPAARSDNSGLHVEMEVRRDDFALDLELDVGLGEVVAVLGPNGSGKSTLLGVIAGLLRPDRGVVRLDDRVLTDTSQRIQVAPHRRGVGLLAQQPLLFPQLSVLDNVAFGPRARRAGRRAAREIALRQLEAVDAAQFAARRPAQLSGGQAARIALARALAADPGLLLLDEPLAAVDVDAAPALRALLRRVLWDRIAVVVTHNVLDALVLADRVLVLEDGRIVEQGTTEQVLSRPRSTFAARLAGLNLVSGTATDTGVRTSHGAVFSGLVDQVTPGEPAIAVFAPSAVAVHTEVPKGSPRNVIRDRVMGLTVHGSAVRVSGVSGISADVTPAAIADLGLHTDSEVWFVVKATEVAVHPRHSR